MTTKKKAKRLQRKLPSKVVAAVIDAQPKIESDPLPALVWNHTKPYYIAVSEWGYDVHQVAAAAIRLAQDRVPAKAKPSPLLVYRSDVEVEPIGFEDGGPVWPAESKPTLDHRTLKLVGLTTTHSLFVERPRV